MCDFFLYLPNDAEKRLIGVPYPSQKRSGSISLLIYSSLESPSSRSADESVELRQPDSSNLGRNLALLPRVRRHAAARDVYRNERSRQYTPLARASAGRVKLREATKSANPQQ